MRPGELKATRIEPDSGVLVTGSRRNAAAVHGSAWLVLVTVRGEDGTFCQVALPTEKARELAGELVQHADLLEGKLW